MEQQADREYARLQQQPTDLAKNLFMASLGCMTVEVLFYRLSTLINSMPWNCGRSSTARPSVARRGNGIATTTAGPREVYLSIDHPENQLRQSFEGLG